ncbi:hypothetical protein F5B17DRAFT_205291 [Nemania serpens]|nr:hypothetical protein F5B17DRAFT_205291 [Nemania serpens]
MDLSTLAQADDTSEDTSDVKLTDMRAIFSDDITLAYNFCTQWSNFTECRTRTGINPRHGYLVGLSEVTTVLRRLFANKMCLVPELENTPESEHAHDGVHNPVLHLACQHPALVKPDSPCLIKAVEHLGMDDWLSFYEHLFEKILHHRGMRTFWAMPRMRLFQRKDLFALDIPLGQPVWMTEHTPFWEETWELDMLVYKGDKSIQQFMAETFGTVQTGFRIRCCNFPPFVRVKYVAPDQSDGSANPGFHSVRYFIISATKIPEYYAQSPESDFVAPSAFFYNVPYTLIACVFQRSAGQDFPAVRLYDMRGNAFQPATRSFNWYSRIGMAKSTWFLFYARCHRVVGGDLYPEFSPPSKPHIEPNLEVQTPSTESYRASLNVSVSAATGGNGAGTD